MCVWDSLIELRSSLSERRLEKTALRPALLPVKNAQFAQFFRQVWRHIVKSLGLTWSIKRPYRHTEGLSRNNCCQGKQCIFRILSVYFIPSYPAFKAHAYLYYCVICSLCGCTVFSHIIS